MEKLFREPFLKKIKIENISVSIVFFIVCQVRATKCIETELQHLPLPLLPLPTYCFSENKIRSGTSHLAIVLRTKMQN